MDTVIGGIVVAVITAGGTLVGTRATNRTETAKNASADWQGYSDRLEKRIDKLQSTLTSAQTELTDIRSELASARTKLYAALDHIRAFRRAVDRALWPTLPEELHEDLDPQG